MLLLDSWLVIHFFLMSNRESRNNSNCVCVCVCVWGGGGGGGGGAIHSYHEGLS